MDIYNVHGRTRTLFVGRFLDDESCNQLIASLLWLEGQSSKDPITLYFNSPGALGKPVSEDTYVLLLQFYDALAFKCLLIFLSIWSGFCSL